MKTIGVLGGMSWESTQSYYRLLNEGVKARLGGFHSARVCLVSVDFADIETLQRAGDWDAAGRYLAASARQVEAGGADCLVLATNTMHCVAEAIETAIDIPLLHIADATGAALREAGIRRVGLLGTRFTMEQPFYRERLEQRHGIEVVVPDAEARQAVHDIIFQELVLGTIDDTSRERYLAIIDTLASRGAEGVILGCTEIALLVQQAHTALPLFDTTDLHARAALAFALDD
ncbi:MULTISPECIES: aspartate/glutamate racemase family protein [unclassified Modicisalibacter]|uniref:aspartate/glutamate racemase family protein n=1 Tax=unclassified Modicisalibacter TaxID=2679913 RepID=UPI001CCBDBEF|nr:MULTISPECIES: aspartate/glutamate racemase family protein [unclassified Modicisalibacter]MBZ9560121.1 aspartate/glutamate racemase family protein [Modicisalibacter sp. R2A 31.J]MBZ9576029.1 aspartate/glutamate racemase family protein [Modicisalibacter sp. MOD 31.J]